MMKEDKGHVNHGVLARLRRAHTALTVTLGLSVLLLLSGFILAGRAANIVLGSGFVLVCASMLASHFWVGQMHCPSCGGLFFKGSLHSPSLNLADQKCRHCGLRLRGEPEEKEAVEHTSRGDVATRAAPQK